MPNSDNESETSEVGSYQSTSTQKSSCDRCDKVEKQFSDAHRDRVPHVFIVHLDRIAINKKRSADKTRILEQIEKRVAALRNTEGGKLLIHIDGQQQDRYLEYLDEFINHSFELLIGDGTLYTDSYNREWLSDTSGYEQYYDFVLIHVEKARLVSTVDFHSLVRKDHENKRPTTENIIAILSKAVTTSTKFNPVDLSSPSLQESRNVELKAFKPKPRYRIETVDDIVNYIWAGLKLKDNLTSISKVEGGGSYFVGISEEELTNPSYKTKNIDKCGFTLLVDKEKFLTAIKAKINTNVCILKSQKVWEPADELIDLRLHTTGVSVPGQVVLEVKIPYVDGIVFNDPSGPRTYKIDKDGHIVRMTKEEWLDRLLSPTKEE